MVKGTRHQHKDDNEDWGARSSEQVVHQNERVRGTRSCDSGTCDKEECCILLPPNSIEDDNSKDGATDILSRYIENLPDPGRVTRSRHAASRLNQTHGNYPVKTLASTFNEISSFDQLSTSDYSSNNSTSSNGTIKRRSGDSSLVKYSPLSTTGCQVKLTPTSDISINEHFTNKESEEDENYPEPESSSSIQLFEAGWESDGYGGEVGGDLAEAGDWGEEADFNFFMNLIDRNKGVLISEGPVKLLIPSVNVQNISPDMFKLELIQDPQFKPTTSLRTHHVSQVISVSPAGTMFSRCHPAYLFIPLHVDVEHPENVTCLYADSIAAHPVPVSPAWTPLPLQSYRYSDGHVIVKTCSLSLFTVVYKEPLPEVRKKIRRRIGGSIRICDPPGIKVTFPRGACSVDIEASIKVLYDFEPQSTVDNLEGSLASPIIMVGPKGYQFNKNRKPVEIELPIPHYREITDMWPRANLSIWQSSTREEEELDWRKIDVDRLSVHHHKSGLVTVSFPTYHFTFFKVVWDILTNKLNEAKMGVSYFYPWMSFPMKCQAYMEENPENKAFGLEVICYNAETNPEQIQTSNYKYCVGSSLKPKLVKPGRILIKLRSQKFHADVDAGEEEGMEKEEPDFRGRDFEKQFALIFREDIKVDRGTFGKVIVDRIGENRVRQENLFEFNLQKSGVETELTPPESSDRWSIVAVKELAGHLGFTEDNKWKNFAKYIGFTKQEIKAKLQHSPDPFLTMMNLYQNRGGTPEEFVQSLYAVGREFSIGSSSASNNSGTPNSTSSGVTGSGSQRSQDSAKNLAKRFSFFNLAPWRHEEGSDSGTADMNAAMDTSPADSKDSRKRMRGFDNDMDLPDSPVKPPKRQRLSLTGADRRSMTAGSRGQHSGGGGGEKEKRRRYAMPEDSYSSSDESGAEAQGPGRVKSVSTEHHKRNPYKLNDSDLWQISASMNAINWRALGRTLGLEESVLLNLEHAHKGSGMRECAYQTLLTWKETKPKACTFGGLYTALVEERMNSVAKSMASLLSQANKSSAN